MLMFTFMFLCSHLFFGCLNKWSEWLKTVGKSDLASSLRRAEVDKLELTLQWSFASHTSVALASVVSRWIFPETVLTNHTAAVLLLPAGV